MNPMIETCNKCHKPYTAKWHTVVLLDDDGCPGISCNRDPMLGPDPYFKGVKTLWERMEAAENTASTSSVSLDKKLVEHKEALVLNAKLELGGKQQKAANAKLVQDQADVIAVAIKATKQEMVTKLEEAAAEITQLEKDWAAEKAKLTERLTFKESRLAELESQIAPPNDKIAELTASLQAEIERANACETRASEAKVRLTMSEKANRNLEANSLKIARANLVHATTIGELQGRNDALMKLCKDNGISVSGIDLETKDAAVQAAPSPLPVTPPPVVVAKPASARAVPPPAPNGAGPVVSVAPANVAVLPKTAATQPIVTTPAPALAPTAKNVQCSWCKKPATMVAKDCLLQKNGKYYEPIMACEYPQSHSEEIAADLRAVSDIFKIKLPDDEHALVHMLKFASITPNVKI